MSDQIDSQNRSEEQVNLSEGTSPSDSYDEGNRSTPSNLPKAASSQRRKKISDSEDEDYVAAEEEVKSKKKKVVKQEFGIAASTKPAEDDEEEEDATPAPKAQKLMGDAINSGAAPSKPKTAPKASAPAPKTAPKRSTRNIPAAEMQTTVEQPQEEAEERKGKATTDAFHRVPRAHRSAAVSVTDKRATTSALAATASVAPPVATPLAPTTSTDAFVLVVPSMPPPEDQA
nr:brain acid soluble protein 1-like [Aegilops tauschii subsp. strangulata]